MFLYELHSHTKEVSTCSQISAAELVRFYKSAGFDGICITDHFMNKNSYIPVNASWEERVNCFSRGYELAKAEGEEIGIDVLFGWEYRYLGADFLTYGLDKEWLYKNPDCLMWGFMQYCDEVHRAGGIIVHAHPCRDRLDESVESIVSKGIDAVEVMNVNCTPEENMHAREYAIKHRLAFSAGTDNHIGKTDRIYAITANKKTLDSGDLLRMIINGEAGIKEFI